MSPPKIARLAESIELRMNEAFWALLPRELAAKRKLESFRVGGAFITLARKSVSLQSNRVRGLGVEESATESMVDEILHLFRSRGIKRFSFHISPCPQSELITQWLKARSFKLHHQYSKLVRDTAAPARVATSYKIKRIGKADAGVFATVFTETFAWQADRAPWIVAPVGAPGFSHYLALDGDRALATALLYVEGNCGWLGWGGTLTPYRHRGAQSALIAARIRRAAQLGAKWVVCETLERSAAGPAALIAIC
ncbi:MAG TPA: GNAT family N-acetyltransferase [Terriglobia bacterium]|nr:GNAT family N-acetyltransferase [Terriglobia bacterium]